MRQDLHQQYMFEGKNASLYWMQEASSVAYAYFVKWAWERYWFEQLPTIQDYNSMSNTYRCPYFTMAAKQLVTVTDQFYAENDPNSMASYFQASRILVDDAMLDPLPTFGAMFCNKLFQTVLYANKIAQKMPNATAQELVAAFGIKARGDNPFLFMVRKWQSVLDEEQPDLSELVHLAYLAISPHGSARIPNTITDLYSYAFLDFHPESMNEGTIHPVLTSDWITL